MQLLGEVLIANGAPRFAPLWERLRGTYERALDDPSPMLVRAALVALLRFCLRLAAADGVCDAALPILAPALQQQGLLLPTVLEQLATAVAALAAPTAAAHIKEGTTWSVLLQVRRDRGLHSISARFTYDGGHLGGLSAGSC